MSSSEAISDCLTSDSLIGDNLMSHVAERFWKSENILSNCISIISPQIPRNNLSEMNYVGMWGHFHFIRPRTNLRVFRDIESYKIVVYKKCRFSVVSLKANQQLSPKTVAFYAYLFTHNEWHKL